MTRIKSIFALFFSIAAFCSVSMQSAYAQTKPAYVVSESEIFDLPAYLEYAKQAVPLVERMGGQFMVRGVTSIPQSPVGAKPQRINVIKFQNTAEAHAFQDSEEFTKLKLIRDKASNTHSFIVEGTAPCSDHVNAERLCEMLAADITLLINIGCCNYSTLFHTKVTVLSFPSIALFAGKVLI